MKKSKLILILFIISLGFSSCEKSLLETGDVEIVGRWSYSYTNGTNITTIVASKDGGKIENTRPDGTSGTLQLKLYFTSQKHDGGSINGYAMADSKLGELEAGHYFHNITFTDTEGYPPYGYYYVTLVLLEYDGEYYIKDYLNFDDKVHCHEVKKSKQKCPETSYKK